MALAQMGALRRKLSRVMGRCTRACKVVRSVYQDSPIVFAIVITVLLLIILLGALMHSTLSQYLGSKGATLVDVTLFWLFARLVARALLFPGSLKIFQRNTEATFRTEMSRQYAHFLRQLWSFLSHASRKSETVLRGVSADGILRGCIVLETLTASFQMQQNQHEVKLSVEQLKFQVLGQEVERWLKTAQVRRQGEAAQGLLDFLNLVATGAGSGAVSTPMQALMSVELVGDADESSRAISKIEALMSMLDGLRSQDMSIFQTVKRFLRVPAVGSLNQLRTELQMRYGGQRCWIPTSGRQKLDGMFIPCSAGDPRDPGEDASGEHAPLKSRQVAFSGPTIIWCNPNAAYYETMVYQANWLRFWLSHGVNLFFFNYSGYGSSTGLPSPARIAEDGNCVVNFLKGKGITQIGVYGRSIGGVTACHLARSHPDVVQLLVADRTMSQLQAAAKYLYGAWAAKGLQFTRMIHNNVDNYWGVRCYKLLVVDPKDTMILDMAALRTAVAERVVERLKPEERFSIDDDTLSSFADIWRFFQVMFAICESDDDLVENTFSHERSQARQPSFTREDSWTAAGALESQGLAHSGTPLTRERVTPQWLQENAALVRSAMAPLADQIRSMLDIVGEHLEGGGTTLSDVLADYPSDACTALRAWLANLQVWGTTGDPRFDLEHRPVSSKVPGVGEPVSDKDIELFLQKDSSNAFNPAPEATPRRLREIGRALSPETVCSYHRRLTRARVLLARKELRRRIAALQLPLSNAAGGGVGGANSMNSSDGDQAERLLRTVHALLGEVDSFVSSLVRFFKGVDLSLPYNRSDNSGASVLEATPQSDSSDEKWLEGGGSDGLLASSLKPEPALDYSQCGYIMHIDCGHNGVMDEVDLRQLALHLRAARFGVTPQEYR